MLNDGQNRSQRLQRQFFNTVENMLSPLNKFEPGDWAVTFDTVPETFYQLVRLPSTDINNWVEGGTGGAGGGVLSFNMRTGAVVPVSGDYTSSQITNDSVIVGTTLTDALNSIATLFILASQKGAVNGVASLDSAGKVPTAQLPPLEVTAKVDVADEAARLALPGLDATMAFQLDTGQVWFIGAGQDKSVAANWGSVASSLAGVLSFNARTGVVVPAAGDYAAAQIANTPAGNLASVTVQAALNELDAEKAPLSHVGSGGAAHALATPAVAGFMSAPDKIKLDAIPTGALAVLANTAPLSVGTINTLGASAEGARADHVHAHGNRPGGSEHALADGANAGFMAAADKLKLDSLPAPGSIPALSTVAPASVGTTNSVGTAGTAARADHVHAHGNRPGGAEHDLVTTTVAGFMSPADKDKLNAYPATPAGLLTGVVSVGLRNNGAVSSVISSGLRIDDSPTSNVPLAGQSIDSGEQGYLRLDSRSLPAKGFGPNNVLASNVSANSAAWTLLFGASGLEGACGQLSILQLFGQNDGTAGYWTPVTTAAEGDFIQRSNSAQVAPITIASLFTSRVIVTSQIRAPRYVAVASVNSGTAVTLSAENNGHERTVTLTGNAPVTLPAAPLNAGTVMYFTVRTIQDATGGRTVTWVPPAGDTIQWDNSATAPAINTAPNGVTIIGFIKHQGNTVWRGMRLFNQV